MVSIEFQAIFPMHRYLIYHVIFSRAVLVSFLFRTKGPTQNIDIKKKLLKS